MLSKRTMVGASAWVLALFAASPAAAQETATGRADAIFREGRASAEHGDYATACARFAESQALDPAVGTLLNIGDCEEHLGHLTKAARAFRDATSQLGPGDDRAPVARARLKDLEARAPRLRLKLSGPRSGVLQLRLDGVPLHPGDADIPVDPGEHVVRVSAQGLPDRVVPVTALERESTTVVLELSSPPVAAPAPPPTGASSLRLAGWVSVGAGGAGMALVGISWLEMISAKHRVEQACDVTTKVCTGPGASSSLDAAAAGRSWRTVNDVGWAVGLAGLGLGVTLVLVAPRHPDAPKPRFSLTTFAQPDRVEVVVGASL